MSFDLIWFSTLKLMDVLPGIISVLVSLMAGKAEVKYDSSVLDAAAVTKLIQDLGFGATLIEDNTVIHGILELTVSPQNYMWRNS